MIAEGVAIRYSKALAALNASAEQLAGRLAALEAFVQIFESSAPLRKLLLAPQLTREEKYPILNTLGAAVHADAETVRFLEFLLKHQRLRYLPQIVRAYKSNVRAFLGIVDADVMTAVPLDQATEERLRSRLEQIYGKIVKLTEIINNQMIGGAIVVIGRKMVDLSIRTRLARLRDQLLAIHLT